MLKFRKKPVVIEAFQMTEERRENNVDWPQWLHEAWNAPWDEACALFPSIVGDTGGTLSIRTLEGVMEVSWGDWIIQGVKKEIYPCKDEIFRMTYEPAEDSPMCESDDS